MSFLSDYWHSDFHHWWIDNVWKPSWTKVVSFAYGIPTALFAGLQAILALAGDDQISQYLAKMNVPNWVPVGLAFLALIHYIAHGRSGKDA